MELPRRLQLGEKIISDTKNYVQLTPKEIIAHSSKLGHPKLH